MSDTSDKQKAEGGGLGACMHSVVCEFNGIDAQCPCGHYLAPDSERIGELEVQNKAFQEQYNESGKIIKDQAVEIERLNVERNKYKGFCDEFVWAEGDEGRGILDKLESERDDLKAKLGASRVAYKQCSLEIDDGCPLCDRNFGAEFDQHADGCAFGELQKALSEINESAGE